ncbi:MAG: HAMP domain-containing sensor histidine kinase [Lachnospiraceae bacterium]|nr:HAMP domain-containing sensor histidine kinase [Lachnospiraceae bacterium]
MLLIIGIIPTIIASYTVVLSYKDRAVALRVSHVRNQCDLIASSVLAKEYMKGSGNTDVIDSQLAMVSNIYNGRLLIIDSSFKVVKDTYDLDTGRTSLSKEVISCFQNGTGSTQYDDRNAYIEVVSPIIDPSNSAVDGVLIASVSTNEIQQNARHLENEGIAVIVLVSMLVLVGGFFISKSIVKPFTDVTRAIEDVTDGYEDDAITVGAYSETEQITDAFNRMLARVRVLDNSRQEFVSNVSHELKTPLTSMKVLADSLNGQDNVPVEIYREFMSDITQEIDRENNIITSLLSMVRMDKKAAPMTFEKKEIGELLEQVIRRLRPIADRRKIELIMDPYVPVEAEVDVTKISLAFSNLIENAVKYNKDEGWVRVSLRSDRRYFYVNVADSGMGIPEDQIEHIFERFYRGDKSHSTEIEGTGLGLAITRSAIILHRGNIKVTSREGEGSVFMVRIPVAREE